MAEIAEKTDPKLWAAVKRKVTGGNKGGKPGQWSARKAQLAVQQYKAQGGTYRGAKTADNHLVQWTEEDWGTKSGRKSENTGERYLPRKARKALSDTEYRRTTRKKRQDTQAGKQFSKQPRDVAIKVAPYRSRSKNRAGPARGAPAAGTRAALYALAREANLPGRSHMTKDQLRRALHRLGH